MSIWIFPWLRQLCTPQCGVRSLFIASAKKNISGQERSLSICLKLSVCLKWFSEWRIYAGKWGITEKLCTSLSFGFLSTIFYTNFVLIEIYFLAFLLILKTQTSILNKAVVLWTNSVSIIVLYVYLYILGKIHSNMINFSFMLRL